MEDYIWIICFLPLLLVLWEQQQVKQREQQRRVLNVKRRRRKGQAEMNEVIQRFIGKECIITAMNANVICVVDSVEEQWVVVRAARKDAPQEIINLDYISRIQEYPRGKRGKKKIAW